MSASGSARSIHDQGYFGGGYSYLGPGPYSQRRLAGRVGPLQERRAYVYTHRPYYYGPHHAYSPDDVGPSVPLGFAIY